LSAAFIRAIACGEGGTGAGKRGGPSTNMIKAGMGARAWVGLTMIIGMSTAIAGSVESSA